jgi:hypothetical protein
VDQLLVISIVIVLIPAAAFLFLRRMRTIQREQIEERHERLYRQVVELADRDPREDRF